MFARKLLSDIYHFIIRIFKRVQRHLLGLPIAQKIIGKAYVPDRIYVMKEYKERIGKPMDMKHPKTFNEKNNWRKIYDRKPIYTAMVDKYLLKSVIAERIGSQYAIPLIGVWDDPKDIDWNSMPDQFVLKCNHASGCVVCTNLQSFDKQRAIAILSKEQKKDKYLNHREWPYKNVKRKIIAEAYMGENLIEYKNYCFNGKVQYTFVFKNYSLKSGDKPDVDFCGAYDRQWNKTGIEILIDPSGDVVMEKPALYEKMVSLAEKMARECPFVSVDCFIINNRVYINEMTLFPKAGYSEFDETWDSVLGDMIKLPGVDD